ncbi:SIR2 family protein [Nannocystis sp. SCPEA4]|uniref:nSTAND1 domain-containing NTPase n=1 Tax=Nannocystis sp. SCPEA4 TaxID=2996787 RepID=UPI00226F13D4|nr:SIR2 family protein [Nannocystis sp. SCPEA4]MCY1057462.1 SIR2 family protein [Nannocystis sp. SCPEA4]
MLTAQQLALVDALERHKLLVCAGPLVSMAAGLPGPRALVERCRQRLIELGHTDEDLSGPPSQALERVERLLGSAAFVHLVRTAWEPTTPAPVPASARALVALSPWLNAIVTTNLDRLLERAFEGCWHTVEEVAPDMAKQTRAIFKIRGTIGQSTTWALTAQQQANDCLFEVQRRRELGSLLRSHVLLFVGFSPDDEEFAYLLDVRGHPVADERRRVTETSHPDVALVPAVTERVQTELGARGVELVRLAGDYDSEAAAYVQDLADELQRRTHKPAPTRGAEVEPAEPSAENPYPGLEPFTADNRRYFFGREDDLSRLLAQLHQVVGPTHQWLLVDGPSGVGKSSLLQAGLVPALQYGEVRLPASPRAWRVVTLRPGPAPVFELATQMHRALVGEGPCEMTTSGLGAEIQRRAAALGEFVAAHLPATEGLVLLVDQLEEALLVPATETREAFAAALAELLVRSPRPLLLITALRSDFSGDLPRLPALHERMTSTSPPVRYTLAPLKSAQLAAAIEQPAREVRIEIEAGLTERVLADAGHIERGAGQETTPETALPLVAAAMTSLYERRDGRRLTHAQYDALGGVAGALTRRADEALEPLRQKVPEAQLWAFFRQLVETDPQGRTTRHAVSRSDALAALGGGAPAEEVLGRLSGSTRSMRLVIVSGEGNKRQVSLVHEALLRNWTWLREHVDHDRAELLRESELAQAAARWDRLGRPRNDLPSGPEAEYFRRANTIPGSLPWVYQDALRANLQRRRRVLRAVIGGLAGGVVTLTVVSVYALHQRGAAHAQTQLAEERLGTANLVVDKILSEALPKLDQVAGTAAVRKEIHASLEALQDTLLPNAADNAWSLSNRIRQHLDRGDLALTHDDLTLARREFEAGLNLAERLVARDPTSAQAQHDLFVSLNKTGDVEVRAGNLAAARGLFNRSLAVSEALAAVDPTSAQVQRDLSISQEKLGDMEVRAGNLAAARGHFDRSLAVREALAAADPTSAQAQRDLGEVLDQLGDLEVLAGNLAAARGHFDRSFAVAEALAAAYPTRALAQHDLSISLVKLGGVELQAGNLAVARRHFDRVLAIDEALAAADPTSAQAQRELGATLDMFGNLEMQTGNLARARGHFDRALAIAETLGAADPTSAQAQRNLTVSLQKLGDVEIKAGNLAAARRHFDRSLTVAEALAAADPTSAQAQRDLSISLFQLGDVEVQASNLAAARGHFNRSLAVAETLAAADPTSARAQLDLTVSLQKLGEVEVQTGNLAAARGHFDRSFQIREAVAAADPTSADAQRDLGVVLITLGEVEVQAGNLAAAREHLDRSLAIAEVLAAADPTSAVAQHDLSVSLRELGCVEMQEGNLAIARRHFDRSFAIAEEVAAADPKNADVQYALHATLNRLGEMEILAGNLAAAHGHFERSLAIDEALAAADPTSAQARHNLSISLDKLGDLEMLAGNLGAARGHFDRSLKVAEALAAADSISTRAQRRLSVSLNKLGGMELQAANLAAARGHFDRSLAIAEALAAADPTSAEAQRDLSVSLDELGYVEMLAGNLAVARGHFDRSLELREALATADPTDARTTFDVIKSHARFIRLTELEDRPEALREHLQTANTLLAEMDRHGQLEGFAEREQLRAFLRKRTRRDARRRPRT